MGEIFSATLVTFDGSISSYEPTICSPAEIIYGLPVVECEYAGHLVALLTRDLKSQCIEVPTKFNFILAISNAHKNAFVRAEQGFSSEAKCLSELISAI